MIQMNETEDIIYRQSLLEFIVEHLPVGVYAKDCSNEFRYILWNKKMEEFFKINRTEVVGFRDRDFLCSDLASMFLNEDMELVSKDNHSAQKKFELNIQIENDILTFDKIKSVFKNEDGTPSLIIGVLQDKTVQHQQEAVTKTLIGSLAKGIVDRNREFIKASQKLPVIEK